MVADFGDRSLDKRSVDGLESFRICSLRKDAVHKTRFKSGLEGRGEAASGETASGEEGEAAGAVAKATFILLLKISQVTCSYLRNPLKLAVYKFFPQKVVQNFIL